MPSLINASLQIVFNMSCRDTSKNDVQHTQLLEPNTHTQVVAEVLRLNYFVH